MTWLTRNFFKLHILLIFCLGLVNQLSIAQQRVKKEPLTIGERVTLYSEILNEDRILNVYLPEAYSADSATTYPVIYLLDGSLHEDFIHVAGIVQFGSFPWINMLPPSIVVGISNVDRKRDFTYPTRNAKDKIDFPTTGSSANFIGFIENELQEFVKDTYKTNGVKTLIGQSLGGLLATQILFEKSELFNNYIIVSPSLWWDDESLLSKKITPNKDVKSVTIAVGKEGEVMEKSARDLHIKLQSVFDNTIQLNFRFYPENDHGDVLHLAVYNAFNLMYKPQKDK